MRDYGKVHTQFWSSDTIRGLSDDGRLLAMYLMTSPHSTIAGVFRLPDGYVCEDMQWQPTRVASAFAELLAKGFANRCETTKWVWVIKHLEWNPPENPNQRKSACKVAHAVPNECPWKLEFMRVCGQLLGIEPPAEVNPSATVGEPFPNQEPEQEQKQEQEHSAKADGDAVSDAEDLTKAELWSAGKSLLASQGMPKAQCGSFVGKLVKDYGDAVVIEAVRAAVVKRSPDAAEYLVGACKHLSGQRKQAEPGWRAEQRERTQLAAPGVAAGQSAAEFFIDVEAKNVTPHALAGPNL